MHAAIGLLMACVLASFCFPRVAGCAPNGVWNGKQCACKSTDRWTGEACCPPGGHYDWHKDKCECNLGQYWDGAKCVCASRQACSGPPPRGKEFVVEVSVSQEKTRLEGLHDRYNPDGADNVGVPAAMIGIMRRIFEANCGAIDCNGKPQRAAYWQQPDGFRFRLEATFPANDGGVVRDVARLALERTAGIIYDGLNQKEFPTRLKIVVSPKGESTLSAILTLVTENVDPPARLCAPGAEKGLAFYGPLLSIMGQPGAGAFFTVAALACSVL